jgi:hypothetical protein
MRSASVIGCALLCAAATRAATANEAPTRVEVADGIHLFMTPDYGDVGHDGNAIAILSDEGVLVFDSNGTRRPQPGRSSQRSAS